jgi:hypothetical protein
MNILADVASDPSLTVGIEISVAEPEPEPEPEPPEPYNFDPRRTGTVSLL